MHQQRVVQLLLRNIYKYADMMSTTVCLELCQLIVFALRASYLLSTSLLDDFIGEGGYQILTHNLISVSKKGNREEIAKFIGLVTHLLFIGDRNVLFSPPPTSADTTIPRMGESLRVIPGEAEADEEARNLLAHRIIGARFYLSVVRAWYSQVQYLFLLWLLSYS